MLGGRPPARGGGTPSNPGPRHWYQGICYRYGLAVAGGAFCCKLVALTHYFAGLLELWRWERRAGKLSGGIINK